MNNTSVPNSTRIIRGLFSVLSLSFFGCIIIQVFLAGIGLFVNVGKWGYHTTFVHVFEFIPLLMLVLSFFGGFPTWIRWQSFGLYIMIILQYMTLEFSDSIQYLAAFHLIIALLLFWRSLVTTTVAVSLFRENK